MPILVPALAGLGFGLSLIVAIGAQNAFVLRQGLRREHVAGVVAFCVGSDAVLIAAGVAGLGALVSATPGLLDGIRVVGALFLLGYAGLALRRAVRPAALVAGPGEGATGGTRVMATCAALTWLNPHVYLDTVLLLGSVAGSYGAGRWWFGGGAVTGSAVWFVLLGFGAGLLGPVFDRPAAWRVLDLLVAGTMATIAAGLLGAL